MVITLTHANDGTAMQFNVPTIFRWYHSITHDCTHVVSVYATFCPVKETTDEVTRLITSAKEGASVKEAINGL